MKLSFESRSGVLDLDGGDETVLFTGLAQGLTLPYECATGTCGTCRARVMSGEVDVAWDAAPGFAKLKRDKGDVLMCQTRARGDCVLRVATDLTVADAGRARPQRFSAVIAHIQLLTPDVLQFEATLDRPMPFVAGQFAVLDVPGLIGGRAYSMVNYSPVTDRLSFVVKQKHGGGFSDWLFRSAKVGSPVTLFGALGRATFRPEEDNDLIVIAGGSGIAGMMSILDCAVHSGHFKRRKGKVFFGVRTLADGFYVKELAGFAAAAEGALDVTLVLSHETPTTPTHPDFAAVRLDQGFVHEAASRALAETSNEQALGFIAGPPPMVDAATRVLLKDAKIPARSIRYDKFG